MPFKLIRRFNVTAHNETLCAIQMQSARRREQHRPASMDDVLLKRKGYQDHRQAAYSIQKYAAQSQEKEDGLTMTEATYLKTVIFQRPERDGGNVAVVKITLADPEHNPIEQVISALTQWVNQTIVGRVAWEESCEDFNIGDLSDWANEPSLEHFLRKHGILSVEYSNVMEDVYFETYDKVLVNEEKLNCEPEPFMSKKGR